MKDWLSLDHDELFAGLISDPEERCYSDHPSRRVLRQYLRLRLREGADLSQEIERLLGAKEEKGWTLSAVSLHVATCRVCAAEVARLRMGVGHRLARAPRHEHASRFLSPKIKLRKSLAYGIPLAITMALIVVLFFLPHHAATSYCRFGALAM